MPGVNDGSDRWRQAHR